MSAKRPRPAIPVLVHVDNPTEAASVVVDTSTIEGKMDTVINNQERIYDKIPTSTGGSSADLTTVNQKITALAASVGPANAGTGDRNLIGHVINLVGSIGDFNAAITPSGGTVKSYLSNIRNAVGNSTIDPSATGTTVRDLLTAIKENTASSDDLTTVNEKITSLATSIGPASSTSTDDNIFGYIRNLHYAVGDTANIPTATDTSVRGLLTATKQSTTTIKDMIGTNNSTIAETTLIGATRNLVGAIGSYNGSLNTKGTTVRAFLYNMRDAIGSSYDTPTATGTTVRDLLTAIKENTASGGSGGSADLTTVNEKTTALAAAIGSASDDSTTVSVIGLLKSITDKY